MARLAVIAIILGGALSVWDDLDLASKLAPAATVIGTNHAGRDHDGPLDHWVTMHPEILPRWIEARRAAARPDAGQLWSAAHRRGEVEGLRHIKGVGGSSGLLAVMVAIEIGATHVMLCGVPMCQNGRHYDRERMKWQEAPQYLAAWRMQLPIITGKVKSFGGETERMLGRPTKEWLDGDIG